MLRPGHVLLLHAAAGRILCRQTMAFDYSNSARMLFIGDSITDCARGEDPEHLGNGYVRIICDYLRAKDPARAPQIINRGISGNKVTDLANRWQVDVLDLEPDLVSIMIGVNDVWHSLTPGLKGVDLETYRATYRGLLEKLRATEPTCAIVLCEPTGIWPPQDPRANEMLAPYIKVVNELGAEFAVRCVVTLHAPLNRAREARPDIGWVPDGAHPSSSGHMVIARAWLEAMRLL
jgi:acyl-CoA thioesterase I